MPRWAVSKSPSRPMTSDQPSNSKVHARTELHALLCSLFPGDGRDLRQFARGDPARASVVDSVSWSLGLDAIVHDFIERCESRGLVDEGLFRRLLSIRPHRRPEIEVAAQRWGYPLPAESLAGPVPWRRPPVLILGSLGFVALVGLVVVVHLSWTQSAEQDRPTAEILKETPVAPATEPISSAPTPPRPDSRPLSPAPQPTSPAKPVAMPRCQPSSKLELLGRLKQAGRDGGALRPCWVEFWGQSAIRARDCPVHLHGDSARQSTLTFTNPKQRVDETNCFSIKAAATFRAMSECSFPVDYTFILADIEPS